MKKTPKKDQLPKNVWLEIGGDPNKLIEYFKFNTPVDSKGRYLPFDEFRFRVPENLNPIFAWAILKSARHNQETKVFPFGDEKRMATYVLTPHMQRAVSYADRFATSTSLELMSNKIGESHHIKYLLQDLIDDEAISSSQLEGAATTTIVAKKMVKNKRKPRTPDERMILGNFEMMNFAWKNRAKELSLDLICELHKIGVKGINDERYRPGSFRKDDSVVVCDAEGEVLHYPPSAKDISKRLEIACAWINQKHDDESSIFIHPLIKAIILHFIIGFEHPFYDGNGRVARALFYWYMFKNEYGAFRYIAVSTLLKKAPISYADSYIHTEDDDFDLTYFLDYQCLTIIKAISKFTESFEKALKEEEKFNVWLWVSGLYKKLNEKQKVIFQAARSGKENDFTATIVSHNLNCSYNTSSTILNELVNIGVFSKTKIKREWHYSLIKKNEIMNKWSKI